MKQITSHTLTALLLAPLATLHAKDKQLGKDRLGKNDDQRKNLA